MRHDGSCGEEEESPCIEGQATGHNTGEHKGTISYHALI